MAEVSQHANFSEINYSQCWEDADVLVEGLQVQKNDVVVSIASGGENTLALLTKDPARVIALDVNPTQLYLFELKLAAFKRLDNSQYLELAGSRPSSRRMELYKMCKPELSDDARSFWNKKPGIIQSGFINGGKFENYFKIFREKILPLIQTQDNINHLFNIRTLEELQVFYKEKWNTWAWQVVFDIFFSRPVMSLLGRERSFFRYSGPGLSKALFDRTQYALTMLLPRFNPYLQYILNGTHLLALPYPYLKENYDLIQKRLDRVEWHLASLEDYLEIAQNKYINRFNLSDIFEYMSRENYHRILEKIVQKGAPGGRLMYWNMMVPRRRPDSMARMLEPDKDLSLELRRKDRAFFYGDIVIEDIIQ